MGQALATSTHTLLCFWGNLGETRSSIQQLQTCFLPLGTRGKHHVCLEQGACAEIPLQMCLLRACSWRRTRYVCMCYRKKSSMMLP